MLSPDMGNIVELSNNGVQQLGAGETVLGLQLRAEVTENDDSWHFRSNKNRSDQKLEVRQPIRVTESRHVNQHCRFTGSIRRRLTWDQLHRIQG